jgi:hypothetical protein
MNRVRVLAEIGHSGAALIQLAALFQRFDLGELGAKCFWIVVEGAHVPVGRGFCNSRFYGWLFTCGLSDGSNSLASNNHASAEC